MIYLKKSKSQMGNTNNKYLNKSIIYSLLKTNLSDLIKSVYGFYFWAGNPICDGIFLLLKFKIHYSTSRGVAAIYIKI